ncbi:MAG: glycosyltransferase family 2 protein [Patescibacteria group bacterium]
MKNYAPIALFVYNRPEHTQKTIEALQQNMLAAESDLFIFADGAKNEAALEGVTAVRTYLKSVAGFKSVHIVERAENYGLAKSIITGVTEIVNTYEQIIIVEDDLVTSPYFLTYMNDGLNLYKHDNKVASIHGYSYAVKEKLPETFFLRGADCWGWATWKRAWAEFNPDGKALLIQLEEQNLTQAFDLDGSYPFTDMLKGQIAGTNNSWAVRWHASSFLAAKLTLYPGISLVDNIGHDTTGTHSKKTLKYRSTLSDRKIRAERIPLQEDSRARALFADYLRPKKPSIIRRIINKIRS